MIDWLNDNSGAVQGIAVMVLAAVTAFYAFSTLRISKATQRQAEASHRMAEETREQRLLTTRPMLLLSPLALEQQRWDDDIANQIIRLALPGPLTDTTPVRIINIGQGVAVDVRVPCKLGEEGPSDRIIDYLLAGSEHIERCLYLAPIEGPSDQKMLKVTYRDVLTNKYESRREFHKEPHSRHYVFTPLVHREVPK